MEMMNLKKALFLVLLLAGTLSAAEGSPAVWHTDYKKARLLAIEKKLPLMICFSGSDWCPASITLSRQVLRNRLFLAEAPKRYILFNADYPKHFKQGERERSRNKTLAHRYSVYTFPTVIVIQPSSERVIVRESNFPPGMSVKAFLTLFDEKMKRK